jgi:hypothetical protein
LLFQRSIRAKNGHMIAFGVRRLLSMKRLSTQCGDN